MAKRECGMAARADLHQGENKRAETGATGQLVTGIGTGFATGEVRGIYDGDPTS
jgi:hypothetical protein